MKVKKWLSKLRRRVEEAVVGDGCVEQLTENLVPAIKLAITDQHEIESARPGWDQIWMSMAHLISKRSIDPRMKVGAVIVTSDNTRVLGIGYNGDYRGGPNSVESVEPGKSGTLHAELNALIKCDYLPEIPRLMYVTVSPCISCAKLIINGRIPEVIYDEEYRDPSGLQLLKQNGVIVRQYPDRAS